MTMLGEYFRDLSGAQRVTLVLIILFFILNFSLLVASFLTDENDLRQMVNMARYISYLKYLVILNMALFLIIFLIYHVKLKNLKKKNREYEETSLRLKSILSDIKNKKQDVID